MFEQLWFFSPKGRKELASPRLAAPGSVRVLAVSPPGWLSGFRSAPPLAPRGHGRRSSVWEVGSEDGRMPGGAGNGPPGPLASYRLVFSRSPCAVARRDLTLCLRTAGGCAHPGREDGVHTGKQEAQEPQKPQRARRRGSAPVAFGFPSGRRTTHPAPRVASQHPKG